MILLMMIVIGLLEKIKIIKIKVSNIPIETIKSIKWYNSLTAGLKSMNITGEMHELIKNK